MTKNMWKVSSIALAFLLVASGLSFFSKTETVFAANPAYPCNVHPWFVGYMEFSWCTDEHDPEYACSQGAESCIADCDNMCARGLAACQWGDWSFGQCMNGCTQAWGDMCPS